MRLILLLLLASAAVACNTTQRLAAFSRTETIDTTTRVEMIDSTAVRERSELHTATIEVAAFEVLEVTVLEYDSARPIDTLTGTPPLQRATTYRRRSEATQNGSTTDQLNQRDTTRLVSSDSSRRFAAIRAQAEQEVERRWTTPWWLWVLKLVVLAVVSWLIWKRLRR